MAKVPDAVEILPKIWTAWVWRTNVTDDRQTTDGRAIAYRINGINAIADTTKPLHNRRPQKRQPCRHDGLTTHWNGVGSCLMRQQTSTCLDRWGSTTHLSNQKTNPRKGGTAVVNNLIGKSHAVDMSHSFRTTVQYSVSPITHSAIFDLSCTIISLLCSEICHKVYWSMSLTLSGY